MNTHDKSIDEVYKELNTSFEGLGSEEASSRLLTYGSNKIDVGEGINPWKLLLSQFTDLLVIILILAAVISGIIGLIEQEKEAVVDVIAITGVVLINAILGFYQELSAEKKIKALDKYTVSEVLVVRDGHKTNIKSEDVVPGDIIFLQSGDALSADIRLVEGYEVRVNESILTGESVPVKKINTILPTETGMADRINILYRGTSIVNGAGMGVVVTTGMKTELGLIAASLSEIRTEESPIQKKLHVLAKQLAIVIVIISIVLFIVGFTLILINPDKAHWSIGEMFMFSVALAVAAIPEGLPAVLTLTLALGVTRMAKRNALIRKLPAVETLGASTVICTDKTGTLTRNEMTVKLLWTYDTKYEVTGTGYFNNGSIIETPLDSSSKAPSDNSVRKALEICTFANESSIEMQGEEKPFKIFGDPTEVSLLILAEKGKELKPEEKQWKRAYLFPFDSERKRMSVIMQNTETGQYRIMAKGAIDVLLDLSTKLYAQDKEIDLTEEHKNEISKVNENLASNFSYRNLGLVYKDIDKKEAERLILSESNEKAEKDFTFLGFVSMIDPPRDESRPAVKKAHTAGINVIMITGDHLSTAKAIAREISLSSEAEAITGAQLEKMSDEELKEKVKTTDVFARVNPAHKLRIVTALKENGEIAIMTGDGVNDAPALKKADVGVAMGIAGTDVAKEASAMILVDDNFANIIDSVAEGRLIFDNMKKFIAYLLSANTGEILSVVFALIFGYAFLTGNYIIIPIFAIQLLFINIVTDVGPAIALGLCSPEGNIMERKPRHPDEPIISKNMIILILSTGIMYGIATTFLYFWSIGFDKNYDPSITCNIPETIVFAALVIYQLGHSITVSQRGTIFSKRTFENKYLFLAIFISILLLLVAIYVPFIAIFIRTAPLTLEHWGMIFLTLIPILIIGEIRKKIVRCKDKTECDI